MARVHFLHARFVNLSAFVDSPLRGIILLLLLKFLMENFLPLRQYLGFFLLVLLEPHHKSFEGLFMGLLQHEIFDSRI